MVVFFSPPCAEEFVCGNRRSHGTESGTELLQSHEKCGKCRGHKCSKERGFRRFGYPHTVEVTGSSPVPPTHLGVLAECRSPQRRLLGPYRLLDADRLLAFEAAGAGGEFRDAF